MGPVDRNGVRHGCILNPHPLETMVRANLVEIIGADQSWVDHVAVEHELGELVHLLPNRHLWEM